MYSCGDQKGIALVVTLLALILITAMVVEFSYGVYTGTVSLYNWSDSQRLSLMARSGIHVSAKMLSDTLNGKPYSYPGSIEFPVQNPFEDFEGSISVRLEDENAKFNLNAIIYRIGDVNPAAFEAFQRLLMILSLDTKIADRVRDWIDPDEIAEISGSEEGAKNAAFASVDELLLVRGISREDYDKLFPYITVYGTRDNLEININGADAAVLMSLSESLDEGEAKKIMTHRDFSPFENIGQVNRIATFQTAPGISLIYKGKNFSIQSSAESGGVKRIIETVFDTEKVRVEYWKEY